MTIAYLLAPIPKWVLINLDGTVAGGANLYTYHSQNKIQQKAVYQDPGGTIPWTNPILFDLNGTQGPFYWEVDSTNLEDTYYLEAYDSDGNLLFTIDNYFPPGTGGGGDVTTFIPVTNYITNNQFIDHIQPTANPIGTTNLVIAPSNHKGFTPALINPITSTYGTLGPDIRLVKDSVSAANATDQITFPLFPLGTNVLAGDVTPVDYLRYTCTNGVVGETLKSFQFPVCQKVNNLSDQDMTFGIWAAVTATPVTLGVSVLQYFGSGTAASPEVKTSIGSFTLTTTWTFYPLTLTIPSVSGQSLGTVGKQTDDDALYIQLDMPLGAPCDVLFTKPVLYLGDVDPETIVAEFDSYDQINSINSTARTGDIKVSLNFQAPLGWVPMNDGTIGNVGSGATTRADQDTFQLYKTIWDGVSNTWAPVSNPSRGASAVADFVAGVTIKLPLSLGRALAGAGTGAGLSARVLGQNVGSETISISAMPAHTHGIGNQLQFSGGAIQGGTGYALINSVTASTGGGAANGNMEPTSFFNIFIKL